MRFRLVQLCSGLLVSLFLYDPRGRLLDDIGGRSEGRTGVRRRAPTADQRA